MAKPRRNQQNHPKKVQKGDFVVFFDCRECTDKFPNFAQLKAHMENAHPREEGAGAQNAD